MEKSINIWVVFDGDNCSDDCLFLKYNYECTLFNKELEDTQLPKGYEWNDREPTKQRCLQCLNFDED